LTVNVAGEGVAAEVAAAAVADLNLLLAIQQISQNKVQVQWQLQD